jgi:antitoxin component of RelBE/YafQ-DinJ toxin-antitoxin module
MKTAVMNFKTDLATKTKAQMAAKSIGIPLSSVLNAYLTEFAATGSVHFTVAEPMTVEMEKVIAVAESEIAAGQTSGPFASLEETFQHLDSLK